MRRGPTAPIVSVLLAASLVACQDEGGPASSSEASVPASPSASAGASDDGHFVDPDCRADVLGIEASIGDYNDAGDELRRSEREDGDYLRYYRQLARASERLAGTEVSPDVEQARDALAAIYLSIGEAYRDATLASTQDAYDAASARIDATTAKLEVIFDRLFVKRGYRCGDSEP